MRFVVIGLAIVLFGLLSACGELALTKSPQATEAQELSEREQPEREQPGQEHSEQEHQEQASEAPEAQPTEAESGPSAQTIEDLKSILFAKTGVASDEVVSVAAEAVDWPDACLGVAAASELCAQVITPGYRVVLHTLDKHYEFHTDRSGENIRMKEEG